MAHWFIARHLARAAIGRGVKRAVELREGELRFQVGGREFRRDLPDRADSLDDLPL